MFKNLWDKRAAQSGSSAKALAEQLAKIERQVEQLLERILDASVPSVIAAYENKVRRLEEEKLLLAEKAVTAAKPATSYDDALRTALAFLSSPWNLWQSERLEDRRTVLKLTFAERLRYVRGSGLRTAKMSLPFRLMSDSRLV